MIANMQMWFVTQHAQKFVLLINENAELYVLLLPGRKISTNLWLAQLFLLSAKNTAYLSNISVTGGTYY